MNRPAFQYQAIVQRVIDGDTIVCHIDLGLRHWVHDEPIRLHGINAPEMVGSDRQAGFAARDHLLHLLASRMRSDGRVILHTFKNEREKFGRWLAIVFADGTNINQRMIDDGHATPFA